MKKTQKRVLGFLGLASVVAVTAVAAYLPGPEASATTSVTDTITVRVVGSVPNVTITSIDNGEVITTPRQNFAVNYENVEKLTVKLTHIDLDGNETTYVLDNDRDVDYQPGTEVYNINFVK